MGPWEIEVIAGEGREPAGMEIDGRPVGPVVARPKSPIFMLSSSSMKIFAG